MKVKVLLAVLTVLVIVLSGCSSGKDTITEAFDYEATGWRSKYTSQEKIEACKIPEETLAKMTTKALVETVVTYPYFTDVTAFDTLEMGVEALNHNFGGLKELMTREDAYQCTLDLINSICPDILDLKPEDDWDEFMKVFNEKNKTKFDIINLINAHTLLKILKNDSK